MLLLCSKLDTKFFCRSLTVDDGDVSVLVVLWQCDRGTRDGGHHSDRPAVVRAVEVVCRHPRLVPSSGSSGPTRQPASSTLAVGVVEGIPCAVAAVRLVDPLNHGGLRGHTGVLTRQNHRLEQHGIPLLIPHKHVDPRATGREDAYGGR